MSPDGHHLLQGAWGFKELGSAAWVGLAMALSLYVCGCGNKQGPATNLPPSAPAMVDGGRLRKFVVPDLAGHLVDPFDAQGAKSLVFIFVATECPISNRYAPEIRRLEEKFIPAGVRFWLVYADAETTSSAVREHLKTFNLPLEALRDTKHDLVRASQVHVTPEAAVFLPGHQLVYHGRIDNRYAALGKDRLEASQHDLEEVLDAVVHGKPAPEASAPAVGCYITDLE